MKPDVYRGALIGCGDVSQYHLAAWAQIEEAEIVTASNRTLIKAEHRAAEFGIPAVYSDYCRMLDAQSLDFVDIAAAPAVHLEMVAEAARRGLHVLCQKPVAHTLADLREMIRVCDEAGVTFMVNENCRFQSWFRKIKALTNSGAIGTPFAVQMVNRSRFSLPIPDPCNGQCELLVHMPRFIALELGVHYVDTLRYLFGEADSVYAQMRRVSPHVQGEDVAALIVRLNGVSAVLTMSWASLPAWEVDRRASWGEYVIEGERGTLYLRLDGVLRLITDDGEQRFHFPHDEYPRSFVTTHRHFVDCLRSGAEPETSGRETLKTMELVFGAYDSAENDRIYRVGHDLSRLK